MPLLPFFKKKKKIFLDRDILKKNDISVLILDERWNSLFYNNEKSQNIIQCEEELKQLLKEQSKLIRENKEIIHSKKLCMNKILSLTEEVYDKNNISAVENMQHCRDEINDINERLVVIEKELNEIPNMIKEANLRLLEETIKQVYTKIKYGQKTIDKLNEKIDSMKTELKVCIDEKEQLCEIVDNAYSYFHDLLGAEQLEKLDKEYLG